MREGFGQSPVNPVKPVIWALVLPMMAIELILSLADKAIVGGQAGIGWRQDLIQRLALSPEHLDFMLQTGRWDPSILMRFVTYSFVHGSFWHALMASVFVLALGKFVSDIFHPIAVLVIFFLAAAMGALAYSLVPGQQVGLIGGYPGAYGLIGAFTFIIWARLGLLHANRNRSFAFVGVLLGFQVLMWLVFGGDVTWVADLVGFATGFGLSFVVAPGGPSRVLRRLRQR